MSLDTDLKKARHEFDLLYEEIRPIIIKFQLESPEGPVYASGFIEILRNAHDDCITGFIDKNLNKMANAKEHLEIAGAEALELTLLGNMNEILEIYREINFILWRRLYPKEIFDYIFRNMEDIKNKLIAGKAYKSNDFHKAKEELQEGIKISNEVIKKFYTKQLSGLYQAEKRISYFVTFGLGIASGFVAGIIVGFFI